MLLLKDNVIYARLDPLGEVSVDVAQFLQSLFRICNIAAADHWLIVFLQADDERNPGRNILEIRIEFRDALVVDANHLVLEQGRSAGKSVNVLLECRLYLDERIVLLAR